MSDILISRKFWASIFGLVVLFIASKIPSFNLDTETAIGFVVVIMSYVLGTALDPGENAGTVAGVLKSRKFWAAVVGLVVLFLNGFNVLLPLGITPDQLIALCVLVGGYIAGVAFESKPIPVEPPVE